MPWGNGILGGKARRYSQFLDEVRLYVERMNQGQTADVAIANDELVSSQAETRNGTDYAKGLAVTIRAMKAVGSGPNKTSC